MNDEIKTSSPCCDASGGPDRTSAVDFATQMRVHVALATRDVEAATRFYAELFEQEPTKTRAGYAKFEVAEPPLNLSLNEVAAGVASAPPLPYHFGIQLKSTGAVERMARRMMDSGLDGQREEQVACCYAVQDKVWFTDPDGHRWEVFVVTDGDVDSYAPRPAAEVGADTEPARGCCGPACCS